MLRPGQGIPKCLVEDRLQQAKSVRLGCIVPPGQAMVGKTGTSVDAHLAQLVPDPLPLRCGHSDFFHCYDGVGRDILQHRGPGPGQDEAPAGRRRIAARKAASSSSTSSSSDGGSTAAPCKLIHWTNLIRRQRKLLRRGQGRYFLHRSYAEHGCKSKPSVPGPGPTRYIVYSRHYLRQSLIHFAAPRPRCPRIRVARCDTELFSSTRTTWRRRRA